MKAVLFILRFGFPYIWRYKARFFSGLFLGLGYAAVNGLSPWAAKLMVERIAPSTAPGMGASLLPAEGLQRWGAQAMEVLDRWLPLAGRPLDAFQITGCLLLLPLLVFLRGSLSYLSSYCMKWASERVLNDLRYDVLVKLSSLSMDYFNKTKTGDFITRVSADTKQFYLCLSMGLSDMVKEPFSAIALILALLVMDAQLALFALILLPFCAIPILVLGRKTRKAGKGATQVEIKQSSLLIEALANIRLVQAYGLESHNAARFARQARERTKHNMRINKAGELVNPVIELISAVGIATLLLFIVSSGRSLSNLAGFVATLALLYQPVKKLGGIHLNFQKAMFGVERLQQTFRQQPTVQNLPGAVEAPPFSHELRLDQVSFGYEQEVVLDGVSLRIPKGTHLGIAGPSGSGKSTLVNMLFRFHDPVAGRILLDGRDLREFTLASLRSQIGLVSQEAFLLDASVAENISLWNPSITADQIEAAARAASAHKFIMELPEGYATRIGERGVRLSGGQKQRISIARALARRSAILILDEATAALDSVTEREVQAAVDSLGRDCTVISVAHRLSTLKNCDHIVVLVEGRLAEEGTYEELVARGGVFSRMARSQEVPSHGGDAE